MKQIFLLSLRLCGIKNIDKEIELEFYKKVVSKNNFDPTNYKVKAIYGENGVGKTAIITAVSVLTNLLNNPNYLSNSESLVLLNELINKKTNELSISCEFVYQTNVFGIYKYSVVLKRVSDRKIIISEEKLEMQRSSSAKWSNIICSQNGVLSLSVSSKKLSDFITESTKNLLLTQSLIVLLKDSFISNAVMMDMNKDSSFTEAIFAMIIFSLKVYSFLDKEDSHDDYVFNVLLEYLEENQRIDSSDLFSVNHLRVSNMIIPKQTFISYENIVSNLKDFIKVFKPDLKDIYIDRKELKDSYLCDLVFAYDDYQLHGEFESTGIKKLVRLYKALCHVENGDIVFIDELDANIHDVYLCKLLEYFIKFGKGQLCFTTHNLGPMEVLESSKKSIDFLSRDCTIVPWIKNGNYSVKALYSKGMIEKSPFNLESFSFLGMFQGKE
ncbi:MAG: ATP-binding protein [Erysipelotrichaceae bacterium]|nr:ATP-binding protein [Erysipelotrichaceae bacterium]